MGAKLGKGLLTALVVLSLLLSAVPALAQNSPNIAERLPAASELEVSEAQTEEVCQVMLITGDVVTVVTSPDGQRSFAISPAEPDKLGQHFLTIKENDNTYIIPDGIDLEKLDMELFNIDYLVDEEYYKESSLPLLVSYLPSLPESEVQSLEGTISALGQETELHQQVCTISTRLAYSRIFTSYNNLMSQPEVEKVWLDKKVHALLIDSVPLIGAEWWWGTTGNKGEGQAIAILDTGIDSSHPALDDLDDNPATNDPKVIVNVNFSSDPSFDDLCGHGTHCAGIAAGTAAGSNYQGVAPGAQLWNVKVLNQWGSGYESWIINGVNFASLGPDGVPETGDEADVISMSIGGPPSDGTDPLSQAVNLAVDRGVVVVVAAGNDGYRGPFTITTPGTAEKAITVGASDKEDNLADFSSRGPTLGLTVKPDILAPGVDITSSMPGGGYESKSGTSMSTPHVAGVAALLRQHYDGTPSPQLIKDALMYTAKDLGYTVYEQGSGRVDLAWEPWPVVGVTPASLSMGVFTSEPAASANLLFFAEATGPPLPHAFYGTLKMNDSDAPPSTTVEARGEGVISIAGNPIVTTEVGRYGSAGPLGAKLIVQGDIADGATITFWVQRPTDVAPHQADQTAEWHSAEITELDLTVTIPPPPPGGGGGEAPPTYHTENTSPHDVTLTASLIDVMNGMDYSGSVILDPASFSVPSGGTTDVTLNIDLTTLPASVYGGQVIATVDGGLSRSIHAIFGFVKARQVNVHKINIDGDPAQGHSVWVLMEGPGRDMMYEWQETDESGNFTFYALDGNYHLLSPNWGHEENQVTVWTIAENVAISGDATVNLDERDTLLVDFDPNKAGQIAAGKSSGLYYGYWGYSWTSWWWYPSSFITRVSPLSRFDASFTYNYYPEEDFNPDNPELINTTEWHNLRYSVTGISNDTTFVADYANLVHRQTGYGVALNMERAYWAQGSWDDIGWWPFGFSYLMDAPQGRWEWLSPDPVVYGQTYARCQPCPRWGEWLFDGRASYPVGEYQWRIGCHPLTSGVDVGIGPVPAPAPAPPPLVGVEEVNNLYINGPISRDSYNNAFSNHCAEFSGHIRVTQDGEVVLEDDIWDSFWESVYFEGTPHFTVEIGSGTPLALSRESYTRLDFTADPTHDYRPPRLLFRVPGINLFGVTPGGEVKMHVGVTDDSSISSVNLHYSLDDGDTWNDAGLPIFEGGWFVFNLGELQETFVTIAVDAEDEYGNHIHRYTNRAFYVGSAGVQVSINAPDRVLPDSDFPATVDISEVANLNAAQYDISFDPLVLRLDDITPGQIDSTEIPVMFSEIIPGTYRVIQSMGLGTVSGSGYLSVLHFHVIGSLGTSSTINLSNGVLSRLEPYEEIPATWIGHSLDVSVLPGDANGDGNINVLDMTKVARIILLLDAETPGADANLDGVVNVLDMTKIARIILMLD